MSLRSPSQFPVPHWSWNNDLDRSTILLPTHFPSLSHQRLRIQWVRKGRPNQPILQEEEEEKEEGNIKSSMCQESACTRGKKKEELPNQCEWDNIMTHERVLLVIKYVCISVNFFFSPLCHSFPLLHHHQRQTSNDV